MLRSNLKLSEVLLYAYVRSFIHCVYFICKRKFYSRSFFARNNYAKVEINAKSCPYNRF